MKAIIFDCDGVIVDSEPTHLKAFQATLLEEGIPLTREEYDKTYLAMDDKGCFETILRTYQRPVNNTVLKKLILRKKGLYATISGESLVIYPGVVDFVRKAIGHYQLAVASGAFRAEIKEALALGGILSAFPVIVSAQDVKRGKPDPEAFLLALSRLNQLRPSFPPMAPSDCVVIEDSLHGVASARAAGMKCLAVTHSYSKQQLRGLADRVVDDLTEIEPKDLEKLTIQ